MAGLAGQGGEGKVRNWRAEMAGIEKTRLPAVGRGVAFLGFGDRSEGGAVCPSGQGWQGCRLPVHQACAGFDLGFDPGLPQV